MTAAPTTASTRPADRFARAGARPTAAVRLEQVSKDFGDTSRPRVLDRIDLTVSPGEFVCLVGASGCGKSTLLSLISGLDAPTSGTVEVMGGRAALMFQEPALFPWLTAGRNVELALRLRGVPRRARADEARRLLDLVHLDGATDKRVHELSGGMRQRVALARALGQEGRVLLMDEPFAALDAITRDVMHDELTRVWRDAGLSVVFVTHNVREAVRLGQRVVLLSSRPGRIVREWTVQIPAPRRIEDPAVGDLSTEITEHLRREIARHGR